MFCVVFLINHIIFVSHYGVYVCMFADDLYHIFYCTSKFLSHIHYTKLIQKEKIKSKVCLYSCTGRMKMEYREWVYRKMEFGVLKLRLSFAVSRVDR